MKKRSSDPIGRERRRSRAQQHVGIDAKCVRCGEMRPEALIAGSNPMICAKCQREQNGMSVSDEHHPPGKSNHMLKIPVPVNDHRATLTPAMYEWPRKIRENPNGSPVLAAAGCILGFCDTVIYLMEELLYWIAEMLQCLDAILIEKLGNRYWMNWHLYRGARQQ